MNNFEEKIRKWVKIDDEIRNVSEKIRLLREQRNTVATSIHDYVNHNNLNSTVINISDGRLRFVETQNTQTLTFKFLEECLNEIIENKASVDKIITHIKNKRTVKTLPDIKRYFSE